MAELTPRAVSGTWSGRLIDIRGYEGEITMALSGSRGAVEGRADAVIGATHDSLRRSVMLSGKYAKDRIQLAGAMGEEGGVQIAIDANIFELAGGGHGMRGTYEVSTRGFSPLRAGVIAASKGERIPAEEVHPDRIVHRTETAGGRR